jgi:hypothetical protein
MLPEAPGRHTCQALQAPDAPLPMWGPAVASSYDARANSSSAQLSGAPRASCTARGRTFGSTEKTRRPRWRSPRSTPSMVGGCVRLSLGQKWYSTWAPGAAHGHPLDSLAAWQRRSKRALGGALPQVPQPAQLGRRHAAAHAHRRRAAWAPGLACGGLAEHGPAQRAGTAGLPPNRNWWQAPRGAPAAA